MISCPCAASGSRQFLIFYSRPPRAGFFFVYSCVILHCPTQTTPVFAPLVKGYSQERMSEMNRWNTAKAAGSALLGGLSAALGVLAPWIWALLVSMALDYITGMGAAAYRGELSSRAGLRGIAKKLACMAMVAAAIIADWVIVTGGEAVGFAAYPRGTVAVMVAFWLIVNELLSILENIGRMEVPLPGFLLRLLETLKQRAEYNGDEGQNPPEGPQD